VAAGIGRARRLTSRSGQQWPAAELAVSLLDLVLARRAGDADAALEAAAAAQGLVHRQAPAPLAAHPELDAVIASNLGAALVLVGRLNAAADAFTVATEQSHIAGREQPLIDALGHRALLSAFRGDLRASADLAGRAVRISSAAGLTPACCPAAAEVALAYVHTETYDISGARRHVALAAGCHAASRDPLATAMLGLARARICRAGGDLEGAVSVLAELVADAGLPSWLADRLALEQVTLLVVDGQTARAGELAAQLSEPRSREAGRVRAGGAPAGDTGVELSTLPPPGASASLSARVDTLLQEAAAHVAAGNVRRAVRELEHALRLAAPELLRRPFREAPEDLWRVLRQHDELLQRHAWLTNRQTGPSAGVLPAPRRGADALPAQDSGQILEPLTDKEREVLGHLSELLTTDEIAAVMFISVNTVRTHVRNILRKLSASRRNEAVRKARELRIIST
jgi:LuxR family maltose regulon positive regulatory protein